MQIFVEKRNGGPLLPVDVEASDTIGAVKAQLQVVYGIPPDKQHLFYDDDSQGELEDGRTLSDYEIQNWCWLDQVVLVLKVPMQIFVKTSGGGLFTVYVDAFDTVDNVKLHIKDLGGIPPDEQCLIFGTKVLSVGVRMLNAYGIQDEALLSLVRCQSKYARNALDEVKFLLRCLHPHLRVIGEYRFQYYKATGNSTARLPRSASSDPVLMDKHWVRPYGVQLLRVFDKMAVDIRVASLCQKIQVLQQWLWNKVSTHPKKRYLTSEGPEGPEGRWSRSELGWPGFWMTDGQFKAVIHGTMIDYAGAEDSES